MSLDARRRVILPVVMQHVDDAASLRQLRSVMLRAPHVQLHRLARLDERLLAHLDGVEQAGPVALEMLMQELASPSVGAVFALSVAAIRSQDSSLLTKLVALVGALPEMEPAWLSALGWVSAQDLKGTVRALLGSKVAAHRVWGLTGCAMHQVDPGPLLVQALRDVDESVRSHAWLVAGVLGRRDLADEARQALAQHRSAAWALALWGEGHQASVLEVLTAPSPGGPLVCEAAARLATLAAPLDWGRAQVRSLADQAVTSPLHMRRMMRMAGWIGDPQVVPWLIHHMADDVWARLAGEVFSMITGMDLDLHDLARRNGDEPESGASGSSGPNDDPANEQVGLDEDESLPWPDQQRVQAWWAANAGRFVAGQRYFGGQVPSVAHGLTLLRTAGQRQRVMAAEHLCLLQPGRKLFPVAAPAWRQSRWLNEEQVAAA